MLNIHDLERRWLTYKIKSYIPLASGVTATIIALILIIIYLPNEEKAQAKVQEPIIKKEVVVEKAIPKQETQVVLNIAVPQNTTPDKEELVKIVQQEPSAKESSTLVLKPSLHFMDNIEDGISPYVDEDYALQEPMQRTIPTQSPNAHYSTTNNAVPVTTIPVKEKKSGLSITSKNHKDDLKDVIRRFKKNKNPALSLFIAKRYYADGKYQQSYNYALMTNEIDKTIEESWLIFSKSLVKLGQHELAINTLRSYIKNSRSTTAQVLLRKIEAGTFR